MALHFRSERWDDFDPATYLQAWRAEADWIGLRFIGETTQSRVIRNEKPDGTRWNFEEGLLIEVLHDGHIGYAGTSDLSPERLHATFRRALEYTRLAARWKVAELPAEKMRPASRGEYRAPVRWELDQWSVAELNDVLIASNRALKASPLVTQAASEISFTRTLSRYFSTSGAAIEQSFLFTTMNFTATAQDGGETQRRSMNGPVARCYQGGLEWLERDKLTADCARIGREALELLRAPNCPSDTRDLIIAPDQMYLQVHESIGHPLELDRILGDERNFAGWSFVQPRDFGNLQYGSKLMNVTFDPGVKTEFASYAFDDCGNPTAREYLIKDGLLLRGLGSLESQHRLKVPGVANFRTATWSRAPIDRMANINVEPGDTPFEKMVAETEKGIFVESNTSWSIDDYRDKFQFGCEYARLIENGKLTGVVKNPNYRGRTLDFWRSLKAVGPAREWEIYGSPLCGKGEPSQAIRVGHASPPCLFSNIEIFGG